VIYLAIDGELRETETKEEYLTLLTKIEVLIYISQNLNETTKLFIRNYKKNRLIQVTLIYSTI